MNIDKSKNILLVEDQGIIAMTQSLELKNLGYNVFHVLSGEKAIDAVENTDNNYDLILMDIDLGKGIDGTQAAEEILKEHNIPVVFLSSHTERKIVEKTEKITSYGYVVKNSGITVLDASIKMAFKLFDTRQELEKQKEFLEQRSKEVIEAGKLNQQVISNAGEGIIVYGNDLRYRVWNYFMENLTGVKSEDVLGKHPLEKFPFLENSEVVERLNQALNGKSSEIIERPFVINENASPIWTVDSCNPLRNADGEIIGVIRTIQNIHNRKQIEEQKEFENENKNALINSTYDLIWSLTTDFKLITANNAFINTYKKYTGRTLTPNDDFILRDSFPVEFIEYWENLYAQVFNGECVNSEIYIPERDNVIHFWLENQLNPILSNNNIVGAACFGRDITEKKRQENLYILEKEVLNLYSIQKVSFEETLTYLLNGIKNIHPSMFCSVLKIKNNHLYNWSSPHLPKSFNNSIEGLEIGYGSGICGTSAYLKKKVVVIDILTDPIVKDYRNLAIEYGLKACWSHPVLDSENNVLATFAIYLKANRQLTPQEELTIERAQIILKNIIENKHTEEKYHETEKFFHKIIEDINGIVWAAVPNPLKFTFVSKQAEKLLGYNTEQWISQTGFWSEHIHPEDREFALSYCSQATNNLEDHDFEYRMKASDGRIIWFRDIVRVKSENSQAKELVGVMIDITKQKEQQTKLENSEEILNTILVGSNDPSWNWDMEHNYWYYNTAWFDKLGYNPEDLSLDVSSYRKLIHPEDVDNLIKTFYSALDSGKNNFHSKIKLLHKNGSYIPFLSRGFIKRDNTGKAISVSGTNFDLSS